MESGQMFKLLDGVCDAQEAMSMILSFYSEKILHYNRELLRNKCYGRNTAEIENKINEIKAIQHEVMQYFNVHKGGLYTINGIIEVKAAIE